MKKVNFRLHQLILVSIVLLSIAYGIYIFIDSWPSLYYSFLYFSDLFSNYQKSTFLFVAATFLISLIIPSLLCLGGVATLLQWRWGKRILLFTFIIDFLVRCVGLFKLAHSSIWPKTFQASQQIDSIAAMSVSVWPAYLIAVVELLILFLLTKIHLKEEFPPVSSNSSS